MNTPKQLFKFWTKGMIGILIYISILGGLNIAN